MFLLQALSRARNLEGLKVLRLAKNMGEGLNAEVQAFYKEHFEDVGTKLRAPVKAAATPKARQMVNRDENRRDALLALGRFWQY